MRTAAFSTFDGFSDRRSHPAKALSCSSLPYIAWVRVDVDQAVLTREPPHDL